MRFFVKMRQKNPARGKKMKNIYLDVEKGIKDLQKIFENTDGADEGLKKFNQKALKEFKN
ncbi:hypothetical protein KYTH76_07880 [Helicobacter pylori]